MTLAILPVLEEILGKLPGVHWISLVSMEGLIIAALPGEGEFDESGELLATECSALLKQLSRCESEVYLGVPEELLVNSRQGVLILYLVDADCFLMALLSRDCPTGKARYLMRGAADKLRRSIDRN